MLEIVQPPNPILTQIAEPVFDYVPELNALVANMAEAMYAGNGVGIAAPQVGVSRRLVIVDPSAGSSASAMRVMVNPTIGFLSPEKDLGAEGCLSLPGLKVSVLRSKLINMKYFDLEGVAKTAILSNLEARIAQHEIDHLDGITLLDKMKGKR